MFKFEKYISKSAVRHLLMDSDLAREYRSEEHTSELSHL